MRVSLWRVVSIPDKSESRLFESATVQSADHPHETPVSKTPPWHADLFLITCCIKETLALLSPYHRRPPHIDVFVN